MAGCFDNFEHEEVSLCPQDEVQAGIIEDLFYIPSDHVDTETLPDPQVATGFAESVTVTTALVPITGKGFQKLRAQVDLNSLTSALVGNKGNKKNQSTVNYFLPGVRAQLVGFAKQMKNVPCIVVCKDRNGNHWQVGTKDNPVYFDNFEITTGQAVEDDNGATGTWMCNTVPYKYDAEIPLYPEV